MRPRETDEFHFHHVYEGRAPLLRGEDEGFKREYKEVREQSRARAGERKE